MNYWRMAMRVGNQGDDMFGECRARGIAAIGYYYGSGWRPVVGDCRGFHDRNEYRRAFRANRPHSRTPEKSLEYMAFDIRRGDVIYVKHARRIVGKGVVTGEYEFDRNILSGTGCEWEHFVRVQWEEDFPEFACLLGAEPCTILALAGDRLAKITQCEAAARGRRSAECRESTAREAMEGRRYVQEAEFRERNRGLIEAKKRQSDYRCEVCEMKFEERYGPIGRGHIVAHHIGPIGRRVGASKTKLQDIALVCSNCHDMLHTSDPPMKASELREILKMD